MANTDLDAAIVWLKRLNTRELYADRIGALAASIDELTKAADELGKCRAELAAMQKERDYYKAQFLASY